MTEMTRSCAAMWAFGAGKVMSKGGQICSRGSGEGARSMWTDTFRADMYSGPSYK
jgi:hypothetical protein